MPGVKLLKKLPLLILFLLFAGGTTLWLLFVSEQRFRAQAAFQTQLERLADELFRSRLEGSLGPDALPEGVRTFAIFSPQGDLVAGWGVDVPAQIQPSPRGLDGRVVMKSQGGWIEFRKALEPLRPRWNQWNEEEEPGPMRRGMEGARRQGYLFVRVDDSWLEGRLWAWFLGGASGVAVWAGLLAFVGALWFRTRRYQADLIQHRELLQFAEASRTLSHELQNPLAAILLQTSLLNRQAGGSPAPEVSIIAEEAQRMSLLVSRVRDFLKDPSGQPETLELREVATSLLTRFETAFEIVADGNGPFPVSFDPHRLRSVVENLLKNAMESGPQPQPKLLLSRPRQGWIRMEVLDSGSGFSADTLAQARKPFFTTKTTGTGIGLSIVESFVNAAGGRLKLENRQEGGARVTVELPEAPREASL